MAKHLRCYVSLCSGAADAISRALPMALLTMGTRTTGATDAISIALPMAAIDYCLFPYYRRGGCDLDEARWARHAALPRRGGLVLSRPAREAPPHRLRSRSGARGHGGARRQVARYHPYGSPLQARGLAGGREGAGSVVWNYVRASLSATQGVRCA